MRILISFLVSMVLTDYAFSKDSLVIISPHRKSIQVEFIPKFEKYYKEKYKSEISVDWLDQGGASDDLKFILARFEKNPKTSMIDILWGGGEHPHYELDDKNLLEPYKIPPDLKKEVPATVAGVKLYNETETWHASALSSFGIFFNKLLLKMLKISKEPQVWSDLADKQFFNNLSNADPRRSSSNVTMNFVILQAEGWDKGWETLTRIAGNTRSFRHSSSDPIKDVVSGDAAAGLAIGYFANAKIGDLGAARLGFSLPAEQSIINPDPISILKGAPNSIPAQRFVEFLLSSDSQKLLLLPKGAKEGPQQSSLARMAVNKKSYEETEGKRINRLNPFALNIKPMSLDVNRVTLVQFVLTDLFGTLLIDHHQELKDAWKAIIDRGMKPEDLKSLAQMPVTEKELETLAGKWKDNVFRNKTINEWHEFASKKYAGLKSVKK